MAVNPKSLACLKPIQKGEIRNPKGKPPGVSVVAYLRKNAEQHFEKLNIATDAWLDKMKHDPRFAQIVLDRLDGAVTQKILLDDFKERGRKLAIALADLIPEDKKEQAIQICEQIFNEQ